MPKTIYFVRHGLSVMNKQGLRAGSIETPLTDEGRAVAKQSGRNARKLAIDCVIASPMERAKETAEIIATELEYPVSDIHFSELLVERHFGVLEGKPFQKGQDTDDVEDIELYADFIARVQSALTIIEQLPGDTILVVSHGATGRAMRHLLNPSIPFQGPSFTNAEIVKLR